MSTRFSRHMGDSTVHGIHGNEIIEATADAVKPPLVRVSAVGISVEYTANAILTGTWIAIPTAAC